MHPNALLGRRRFLAGVGATIVLAACSDDDASSSTTTATGTASPSPTAPAPTADVGGAPTAAATSPPPADVADATTVPAIGATAFTAADFDALGTCTLLPEQTAGPFPLDEQFERRDITEDHPGHPLRLGLRVTDQACAPVAGAAVEIWHADASGDYSAFADGGGGKDEGTGTTFLRGTQVAGDDGIVEFLTIYPGWYRGRAVHIHLRVHVPAGGGDTTVLTSQLYFDEEHTAGVYAADPYAEFGLPDTSNASDGIAGDPAAEGTLLRPVAGDTSRGAGSVALVNLGIDPNAV